MTPQLTFLTSEFQFSHGRLPRGRGLWAFQFDGSRPWFAPSLLSFAEAKKAATDEAKARGLSYSRVTVCP